MWFARFQILIGETQTIWCKLLVLIWLLRNGQSFQVDPTYFHDETKNCQIAHFELSPEEGVASEAEGSTQGDSLLPWEPEGSTPGAPPRTWSAAVFNIEDGGWSWVGFRLCIIGLLDFEYLVSFLLLLWSDFSIKLTESLSQTETISSELLTN